MEVNSISFFAFLGLSSVIYRYTKKDNAATRTKTVSNLRIPRCITLTSCDSMQQKNKNYSFFI